MLIFRSDVDMRSNGFFFLYERKVTESSYLTVKNQVRCGKGLQSSGIEIHSMRNLLGKWKE